MKIPNFSANEFIDQNALNNAFNTVSGAIAYQTSGMAMPGLIHPEAMTFSGSGLTLTSTLNSPMAALFGTGTIITAHGSQTNTDTKIYTTSFSGLVPASGAAVTAYLLASSGQIQLSPFQVVGPPQGHPDYNPAFVPYTAYAQNVDTLLLNASLTAPDNQTTFELCRFSLASGASGLGTPNTTFQFHATSITPYQSILSTGSVTITPSGCNLVYVFPTSGGTLTLPLASGSNGLWLGVMNASSGVSANNITTQVQGTDTIYGWVSNPSSGLTTVLIPPGACVFFSAVQQTAGLAASWNVVGGNQFGLTASGVSYIANAISGFVRFTNAASVAPVLNGQGVSGIALTIPPTGNIPSVQVSGGSPTGNPGIVGALWIN